jgi:hypothetical protein
MPYLIVALLTSLIGFQLGHERAHSLKAGHTKHIEGQDWVVDGAVTSDANGNIDVHMNADNDYAVEVTKHKDGSLTIKKVRKI